MPTLPHRFPFLLVDAVTGGDDLHVRVRLTAAGTLCHGGHLSSMLLIEMVAQSAALLEAVGRDRSSEASEADGPTAAYMAGVDRLELDDGLAARPLLAGDTLVVRTERSGGFGRLFKVRGVVHRGPDEIARAELVLMQAG